jgi:hypothetical protein
MENRGDWMNSTGKTCGLPFGDVTLLWEMTILSPMGPQILVYVFV